MVDLETVPQGSISGKPVAKFILRPVAGPKDLEECPEIEDVIMVVHSDQPALIIYRQAGRGTRCCPTDVGSLPCQSQSSALYNVCLLHCHRSLKPAKKINWLGPHLKGGLMFRASTPKISIQILNVGRVKVKWVVIYKCPHLGTNIDSTIASIRLRLLCSLQRCMGYTYLRVVTHLFQV